MSVAPLPAGRSLLPLFQPRALLHVRGEDEGAAALRDAIRLKFLRVGG